jgi:DNA-binding LytR/AlgR family response regulator
VNASVILDRKAAARGMFVQEAVRGNALVSPNTHKVDTVPPIDIRGGNALEAASEVDLYDTVPTSSLRLTQFDITKLIGILRQLEIVARQQSPRIAFKAKGRIVFMDLAEIIAVQAEGNYVSLQHRTFPYLLRDSISSIAQKLKPYGFVRIHRSVVVNISAVEEIQPLTTGEYRLRVKGGTEYMMTRTYKDNLRDLAQLWVGSERLCG